MASPSEEPGEPGVQAIDGPSSRGSPAPPRPGPFASILDALAARWDRLDGLLYPLFAGAAILYAAVFFYGSLHRQTHGIWSAPLDDVFIHFDYARATARGYPFQWSEGNGFSSGNTSLSYPFVLAFGYWVGFRGLSLMHWAAIVACLSTLGFLMVAGRAADALGRWVKYLIPPVVLGLGALDWTLFSGMENAFHLGVWALALLPVLALVRSASDPAGANRVHVRRFAWLAGAAGLLLYATRPESVVCVASFAVFAAVPVRRSLGNREAFATVLRIGVPGALGVVAQAAANRVLTGEWSANGAIAKLALNNPYMTASEKWAEYTFLIKYVIVRNTEHHFTDDKPWGWIVPVIAAVPLFAKRVRALSILLWVQIAGWLALVSLNGQVRWQNERYTMAAVAWLLVLAAMGLAVIAGAALTPAIKEKRFAASLFAVRAAAAITIGALLWSHQLPNMRDQIWFFGRASRNIRDQHLVAGKVLAELDAHRVLVGDAGALMYASDRPGLDIIGLGGYHDLPFARAGVHGLGASLELIERLPRADRPDLMAIYPSWWGDLPTLFGHRVTEVPVHGNVICGGSEKVIYHADWSALDDDPAPRTMKRGEVLVDELDVADLVSERQHRYEFPHPAMGFVDFRVLADPADPARDLFDAGRVIPPGQREIAVLRAPRRSGRLIVRAAVGHHVAVQVHANGGAIGQLTLDPGRGWIETSLDLPDNLPADFQLWLTPMEGDWLDCHVWIVESGSGAPARSHRDER